MEVKGHVIKAKEELYGANNMKCESSNIQKNERNYDSQEVRRKQACDHPPFPGLV